MLLNDVSLDLKDSSGKESKDCWKMEKWMSAGQREKRKDEWVETAESLGFCLNNQILLFMWSKLLRSATGHVEKLNDCKERQRQANGLLRGSVEALRGKLRGRLCMLFAWWRLWHHDVPRLFFCLWFCASQSYRKMMRIHYWFILFYFIFYKWKLPQYAWDIENETFEQIVTLCVVNGHLWRYVLTSLNILSWQKHLLLCFATNVPF